MEQHTQEKVSRLTELELHTPTQLSSRTGSSQSSLPPKEVSADASSVQSGSGIYKDFEGIDDYVARRGVLTGYPKLPSPLWLAKIRFGIFTTYRRLFGLVFMGNMIGLIIVATKHRNPNAIANAVAVNLSAAGLIRLPHIINIFYNTFCSMPTSFPLFIRVAAADVSHFGGVHSGCGFSALCWYIALCGVVTRDYVTSSPPEIHDTTILVLLYLILLVIMGIVGSAYPALRFKNHDMFEFTHRFSGWVLTALFWAFIIVFADKQADATHQGLGITLIKFPSFWFAIMLTMAFSVPWITLKKIPVRGEHLSDHAVRLHFTHATTGFAQGIGVSHHPFRDWHNFAGIPNIDGTPGFSVIVSKVGDFTGGLIQDKPTMLYKRGIPGSGFGHAIILFRKVLLITTGSGMGPCLSLLASSRRPPTRIFWQTRNPRKTYGDGVLDLINAIDPKAVVCDTDRHGRQDMFPVAWDIAKEFGAEAVFVVSRPWVVRNLTFQFQARGIPAFGPIFDQ